MRGSGYGDLCLNMEMEPSGYDQQTSSYGDGSPLALPIETEMHGYGDLEACLWRWSLLTRATQIYGGDQDLRDR